VPAKEAALGMHEDGVFYPFEKREREGVVKEEKGGNVKRKKKSREV